MGRRGTTRVPSCEFEYFDCTTYEVREPVRRALERLKWFLWHGNVYQALQVVQSVAMDLEMAVATSGDGTARVLSQIWLRRS